MLNLKHISNSKTERQLKSAVGRVTVKQEAFFLAFQQLPQVWKTSFSV